MAGKMKAIAKMRPEPGLELVEWDIPVPDHHEVLVKVKAAAICGTDLHIYNWDQWSASRIHPPMVTGHEFCGEVVEVGDEVTLCKVGDFVSAESHIYCGVCPVCRNGQPHVCANLKILGIDTQGAFAEYACIPESIAWKNDPSLDPKMAAILEPLGNAVYAVLAEPIAGRSVCIIGDGPAGLSAVAVAKAAGAAKIFHIGMIPFRMAIGKQLGADVCLNINEHSDCVTNILDETSGFGVDVVVEMTGSEKGISDGLRALRKGGRYSAFGLPSGRVSVDFNDGIIFKGARLLGINGRLLWETWNQMAGLLGSGALDPRPVVTHTIALEDFDSGFKAMNSVERTVGKVVMFPDPRDIQK